MARKSKNSVIDQAAKAMAKAGDKAAKNGKETPKVAGPSNVTDETIDQALARIDEAGIDLDRAKEAQSKASGVYRNAIKAAKQMGLNNDAILEYRRMKKMEPGDYASMMTGAVRMAKIRNLPIGTQLDLLGDTAAKAEATPYNAGRAAAGNREPKDNNPHEPGSEGHQQWAQGYDDWMFDHLPKAPAQATAH